MQFQVKETVQVHLRKRVDIAARAGEGVDITSFIMKESIASSWRNNAILRGVSFNEETILLPNILGVSPKHEEAFVAATKKYWVDIDRPIPPYDIRGKGGGLYLEVGFNYKDEESMKLGEKIRASQHESYYKGVEEQLLTGKEFRTFDEDERVVKNLGTPINVEDYLLYRYCLRYSHVAKDERLVEQSSKIRAYLVSEEAIRRINDQRATISKTAMKEWLDLTTDTTKLRNVLVVMQETISRLRLVDGKEYTTSSPEERESVAKVLAERYPELFIATCKDETLGSKAFINECVNRGILKRIANTDTIYYGDNTLIGRTTNEAILFLKDESNSQVYNEIKAKMKMI